MKKEELKNMKSLLKGITVVVVAFMFLTNCGTQKSTGTSDITLQSSEYQLSNDCALLHLYRPATKIGVAVSYAVHLDDEVVFQAKYNSKTTVRVTSEGLKKLWGQTEARVELPVNIQLGNEYYVKCRLGLGAFVGRPSFVIVDNKVGKKQYGKIRSKK